MLRIASGLRVSDCPSSLPSPHDQIRQKVFDPLLVFVSLGQSLDPTVQLSWSDSTYSPDEVKNSWGTTFGGSSTTNGKTGAYASGSSQKVRVCVLARIAVGGLQASSLLRLCVDSRAFWSQAFDMAYMLNGKFALKHDPTLTGRHTGKYL